MFENRQIDYNTQSIKIFWIIYNTMVCELFKLKFNEILIIYLYTSKNFISNSSYTFIKSTKTMVLCDNNG